MKSRLLVALVSAVFVCALPWIAVAQQGSASSSALSAVPNLINYSGVLINANGRIVTGTTGVTFLIYKDEQGGAPLWLETQNVRPDATGRYTVQLGSASAHGLPAEIFLTGEERWLALQISSEAEQPRVLLVAVPYAMKAGDAETIGGLPPSAFVLAAQPSGASSPSASGITPAVLPPASVTGSGTADYVPLWTSSSALTNSVLYQTGSGSSAKVGINTITPQATLDVAGGATIRGLLNLPNAGNATASAGVDSRSLGFVASAFNSGTAAAQNQVFHWQAEPVNNDTASPTATLNLLFAVAPATAAETGLKINNKGQITFAAGQSFPGTGGVNSVGLAAPSSDFTVSGSPVTSSGTLNFAWNIAPTNANTASAIVKRDAGGGFSAGPISATSAVAGGAAVTAIDNSTGGYGIEAVSNTTGVLADGSTYGVYAEGSTGVYGTGTSTAVSAQGGYTGVNAYGTNTGTFSEGASYGVYGAGNYAFYGSGGAYGVYATGGTGVYGAGSTGVIGVGVSGSTPTGVYAQSGDGGWAVDAYNTASGTGILAGSDTGYAGWFNGETEVDGTFYADKKNFKIDHPLDPANKYLVHSSVESSEMMNLYTGNVTTDAQGLATVQLPDWFESLNTDFRYQLTVIGQFAQAIVARKIENHQFQIRTSAPAVEVSWQVTGVRQDAYAKAHPTQVEVNKPEQERGFYLHPELYGAPEEKGVLWARSPQAMKQWKEARTKDATTSGNKAPLKP